MRCTRTDCEELPGTCLRTCHVIPTVDSPNCKSPLCSYNYKLFNGTDYQVEYVPRRGLVSNLSEIKIELQ
jgi:hypothetical protein